jgi:hypothetical protein
LIRTPLPPGTTVRFVDRYGYGKFLGIPDGSPGYVMPADELGEHLGLRVFFPELALILWVWRACLELQDPAGAGGDAAAGPSNSRA